MTRKPLSEEVARDRMNAAAFRFRQAQAKLNECREHTDLANLLEGKLFEAQSEWNDAVADYGRTLSDYADALLEAHRRPPKRPP
jgi:hypothetical protein